jgi:hypothetical protein
VKGKPQTFSTTAKYQKTTPSTRCVTPERFCRT